MKFQTNPRRSPWPWVPPTAFVQRCGPAHGYRADRRTQEGMVMNSPTACSAHEVLAKLAYECWERRGRPLGSPEIDWSTAESALLSSLPDNRQDFSLCGVRLEADEGSSR